MMKALKYTPRLIDIDIQEITLLSEKEYEAAREHIKPIEHLWWLRSPGYSDIQVAFVDHDGFVNAYGYYVDATVSVRPALRMNGKSNNLKLGDRLHYGGYDWTFISENLALCDTEFCKMNFREDWKAKDANVWEVSDIKKSLDDWLEERRYEWLGERRTYKQSI